MYPRGEGPEEGQTEAYVSAREVGTRMIVATPREAESAWSPPKQVSVPVSLRACATCGALQPYVAPGALRALVEIDGPDAVYVDHDRQGSGPFR